MKKRSKTDSDESSWRLKCCVRWTVPSDWLHKLVFLFRKVGHATSTPLNKNMMQKKENGEKNLTPFDSLLNTFLLPSPCPFLSSSRLLLLGWISGLVGENFWSSSQVLKVWGTSYIFWFNGITGNECWCLYEIDVFRCTSHYSRCRRGFGRSTRCSLLRSCRFCRLPRWARRRCRRHYDVVCLFSLIGGK